MLPLPVSLAALLLAPVPRPPSGVPTTLSEIQFNAPGADTGQEFIELRGEPGDPLTGLWLLVIEGDGAVAGTVDNAIDLGALSFGSNGLLLLRDSATVLLPAPAAGTSVVVSSFVLENGANTYALGFGTAPTVGMDLDSDNDGTLNVGALAGFTVLDAVAYTDMGVGSVYADELGGTVIPPQVLFDLFALYRIYDDFGIPVRWSAGVVTGASPGPYPWDMAAVYQVGSCMLNPGNLNENRVVEVEPNGPKLEATPVDCLSNGDTLCGTTTGTSTAAMDPALTTADTYRIKTCPLPLGIYRHELRLVDGVGGSAHGATIRGLLQNNMGVIDTASDTPLQSSSDDAPGDLNAWYGFGRGEEVYYRATGFGATTLPYVASLSTTPAMPTLVPGTFRAGQIELLGLHGFDSELHLFDGNLVVIDGANNDDHTAFLQPGRLLRTLPAGTYYLAVGRFNTATNDNTPADDFVLMSAFDDERAVMDFPNGIITSHADASGSAISVRITDCTGMPVTVMDTLPAEKFGIRFLCFTVVAATSFCHGDGSMGSTPCPCGNTGAAGNGCGNSANPMGAHLSASGAPSLMADTLLLSGTGMPSKSCFYYQGTVRQSGGAGIVFGDGLRCAGGVPVLIGYKLNVAGASSYPGPFDPSIATAGGITAMTLGTRTYQILYHDTVTFCTPSQFNGTNGLNVCWTM